MSERKYTDEQIVKALECCSGIGDAKCVNCPYHDAERCAEASATDAIDLINRQKAEIAVLITAVDNSTKEFLKLHDEYQDQKKEIEKLHEVNADLNESLRLAAEANKDMKIELDAMRVAANSYKMCYEKAKAEAIKEFAERVINLIYSADDINPVTEWQIDNLVAELTEGK